MGRLIRETIRAAERFYDASRLVAGRLSDRVRIVVPFEPDSNLVCIALNPTGNESLAAMNRFGRQVFQHMKVDAERPVQAFDFIGSYTSLTRETLPGIEAKRVCGQLGIDFDTFRQVPENPARESDHLFLLRHTLMNPFLLAGPDNQNYIDLYWTFLEQIIDEVLASGDWR